MRPDSPKLLEDIRGAAQHITDRTTGATLDAFRQDLDLRRIVERNFEIIGEAARRLRDHDLPTAQRLTDYADMIAFRNVLIHAYDIVNPVRVSRTVQVSLPLLLTEVQALLREAEDQSGDDPAPPTP